MASKGAFPGVAFHAVPTENSPQDGLSAFPGIPMHVAANVEEASSNSALGASKPDVQKLIRRKSAKALNMLTFKSKSSRQKSNLPLSSGSRREADDEDTTSEERVTIKFCTDEEGNVTNRIAAASINKLIEYMTHETIHVDNAFRHTFFLTYHSFTSPSELLEKLMDRFMVRGSRGSTKELNFITKIRQPIRLKVLGIIKMWVLHYYSDFEDDPRLIEVLQSFLNTTVKDSLPAGYPILAETLQRKQSKDIVKDGSSSAWKFLKRTKDFRPEFAYISPSDIAEQLTLIEQGIFIKLTPKDFLNRNWLRSETLALSQLLTQFERVSGWVKKEIDSRTEPEAQLETFLRFVAVAKKMHEFNNFQGLMEIIGGLQSTVVWRKRANTLPPDPEFQQMIDLISENDNYRPYRKRLEATIPPLIPALQVIIEDINKLDELEADVEEEMLVNWSKKEQLANLIYLVFIYQKQGYSFLQENADVKAWLLKTLAEC